MSDVVGNKNLTNQTNETSQSSQSSETNQTPIETYNQFTRGYTKVGWDGVDG